MRHLKSRSAPSRCPIEDYPEELRPEIQKLRDQQDRAEHALAKHDRATRRNMRRER